MTPDDELQRTVTPDRDTSVFNLETGEWEALDETLEAAEALRERQSPDRDPVLTTPAVDDDELEQRTVTPDRDQPMFNLETGEWEPEGYVLRTADRVRQYMAVREQRDDVADRSQDDIDSATVTADDVGKSVVSAAGEEIGYITRVDADQIYVDPHPTIVDSIASSLGWGDDDVEPETYPVSIEHVEAITDDHVELDL